MSYYGLRMARVANYDSDTADLMPKDQPPNLQIDPLMGFQLYLPQHTFKFKTALLQNPPAGSVFGFNDGFYTVKLPNAAGGGDYYRAGFAGETLAPMLWEEPVAEFGFLIGGVVIVEAAYPAKSIGFLPKNRVKKGGAGG